MKYSIIIPTLNEEKFILNLLNVIGNQLLKNEFDYEVIISDGGSSDSTLSIVKKYADQIVSNNYNTPQNIAGGRNLGASISKGDILIFLNADVAISNVKYFFKELDYIFNDSRYVAYTCKVSINQEEEILSDKIFMNFYNHYFHFLNIINIGMGRGECQVIKKTTFDEVCGYNENLAAGEDFDLFRRIRKIGKIYFSHQVIVYESPRRYRKYGHIYIFFSWLINSIFVILIKKSFAKKWEEVR